MNTEDKSIFRFRFKTEKEFLEEFEKSWREEMGMYWNCSMDHLLGKTIGKKYWIECYKMHMGLEFKFHFYSTTARNRNQNMSAWVISKDMIKLQ